MKVRLLPGRFDIEFETPEDAQSLLVHCENCGCLYSYGPDNYFNRRWKYDNGVPQSDFLAIAISGCPRCGVPDGLPPIPGGVFLGRFPETIKDGELVTN